MPHGLKTVSKLFLIGMLALSLSYCGFQPRGKHNFPPEMQTLYISSSAPYQTLTLQVKEILKANNIHLVDDPLQAPVTLHIYGVHVTSDTLSESASSKTKQYVMVYNVNYELTDSKGTILYGPKLIHTARDYMVNEDQVLSVDNETELLLREMQRDLAFQLLRQLDSNAVRVAVSKVHHS